LNSFAGFSIEGSQLLLPAESDGTNLIANATLPNPSVMTLEIVSQQYHPQYHPQSSISNNR
jgi:hypothetical protein